MPETRERWSDLAELSDEAAREAMAGRFHRVAAGPEETRLPELRTMIVEEYELGSEALQRFTANRLRSWLALPSEEANIIADGYNTVFASLPSEVAMRRASTVQTVARTMTPDEVDALHQLMPSLMSQIPSGKRLTQAPVAAPDRKPTAGWKFWKR